MAFKIFIWEVNFNALYNYLLLQSQLHIKFLVLDVDIRVSIYHLSLIMKNSYKDFDSLS